MLSNKIELLCFKNIFTVSVKFYIDFKEIYVTEVLNKTNTELKRCKNDTI